MKKICEKCDGEIFRIIVNTSCDDCPKNGAYDNDADNGNGGYVWENVTMRNLTRDQVEQEGECGMGVSFNLGCYLFVCDECGGETHLPLTVG